MKLGIGLIIIGTIYLTDGALELLMTGGDFYSAPLWVAGAFIKFIIAAVFLFFGIRRLKRDKARGIKDAKR